MHSRHDTDGEDLPSRPDEECVELALLVPSWQWAALEIAANAQGLMIGQLLRRLIAAHLAELANAGAPTEGCRSVKPRFPTLA